MLRDNVLHVGRFCMQFSEVPNMSEPNLELLSKAVSLCYLFLYSHSESARNPRMFSNFTFLSVQVPSIVLKFNSMFSNVLKTKCLENSTILAVYWRKELNKFAHPTTSGKKKRRDPNSCRTNARQPSTSCVCSCDAHFACRSANSQWLRPT